MSKSNQRSLQILMDAAKIVDPLIRDVITSSISTASLQTPAIWLPSLREGRPKHRAGFGLAISRLFDTYQHAKWRSDALHIIMAAMELSAMATYVLDDIIDGNVQTMREGHEATHVVFGANSAWIAGSRQMTLSLKMLQKIQLDDTDLLLEVHKEFINMWDAMWEGEGINEVVLGPWATDELYYERCDKIAAIMYEVMARLTALMGDASPEEIDICGQLGHYFGMIAMVGNDLMCYLPPERLAKVTRAQNRVPYEDIKRGIWTYPAIVALRNASATQRELLLNPHNFEDDAVCAKFVKVIKMLGGIEATLQLIRSLQTKFVNLVNKLPDDVDKQAQNDLLVMGENLTHVESYFA